MRPRKTHMETGMLLELGESISGVLGWGGHTPHTTETVPEEAWRLDRNLMDIRGVGEQEPWDGPHDRARDALWQHKRLSGLAAVGSC